MIKVHCRFCPEEFEGSRISQVMEDRRMHEESRHREAKIDGIEVSN